MRPSADNAATFATRAKLHSPACLPYEKIRPHHSNAAAFVLVTGLYAPDVLFLFNCFIPFQAAFSRVTGVCSMVPQILSFCTFCVTALVA